MGLGTTELILILVIVLVLFGAKKLPDIGAGLARGIKSFRTNMADGDSTADEVNLHSTGGKGSKQDHNGSQV
ncbi:MAG: twin-arginine translocase TatA/TatE family subunit [Mariprofundales bacterium]|nr:twin-arginine translocase TatA/TatE family subunit [Mariprofundales bacterium]